MSGIKKFTLIELLVVVAILGILLSILLPSLSKAREKGRDAVCKSNNRQIGTAMMLYTDSNDYRFPSFYRYNYEQQTWHVLLGVQYLDIPGDLTPSGGDEGGAYINSNESVFSCPSVMDMFSSKRTLAVNSDIGYFFKNGQWHERPGRTKITSVIDAERCIYSGDAGINNNGNGWWLQLSYSGGTNSFTQGPLFNPFYQHSKKANNVYMDLHVAPVHKNYATAFYAQTNNPGYTWMTFFRGWE
ncbi:MAG: prepilin-type N-terminal cleavage/methylation domain-containing protein [Lentisphaeraceae bacterium]|nr:prepilin-type N-terminal cleavage/methylation domain-containing protein [Lentisphaeraceae bacterium]